MMLSRTGSSVISQTNVWYSSKYAFRNACSGYWRLGATYIGFRAKGWRSVLPFQGGDSTLRIYLRGMKEERWPKWPFYLWLVSIPVTLFFFFRFAVELARH
jgi:hypothetical protein